MQTLAVTGFRAVRDGGPEALTAFPAAAARLVAPKLSAWRERWQRVASHLSPGGIDVLPAPSERGRHGMCGLLDTYHVSH